MKLGITDIHTHVLPDSPGSALVCIDCGPVPEQEGHFFSAGLHPWDVTGCDEPQLRALEHLFALPQVLAVGECGFDTLRGPSHELQEQAFIRQAELSERFKKPMILHVVRDFDSIIRLRKQLKPSQRWLIHGFRGGQEQAFQLISSGFDLSLGARANPDTVRSIPDSRLFLETDGKTDMGSVINSVAGLRGKTAAEILKVVARNVSLFLSAG